ncbi:16620_t:CDS:2 [Funneliformis caledonium]|uniref:16620_t:CDS:1 n=1 Tax=Funneliformis caledonium TaxID=1117310 RepID=A0A9N8VBZ0_9GLOM|nr:16620_t:CDS:2 [Funneliformis caledonium]
MRDCKGRTFQNMSLKKNASFSPFLKFDNKIKITKDELKKWHIQPELNSSSEDDSGFDFTFNDDLFGDFYEGRDTYIEDNSSTSRVAGV